MMTVAGPGFCPRCGTARVGDMPFCPKCGLNVAEFESTPEPTPAASAASTTPTTPDARPATAPLDTVPDRRAIPGGGFSIPPLVLVIALVVVGLVVLGLLRLPQVGGNPPPAQQATLGPSGGVAAPIVGLSILSPADGQAVATKDVLVIGLAPPGLGITQDVSFGLDQHTNADGTGHWAIKVGLNGGDNVLKFRIGDDRSTEKTVRVIYTPPG